MCSSDLHRYDEVVAFLALADGVRGFDHVKERNVAEWRTASAAARSHLGSHTSIEGKAMT